MFSTLRVCWVQPLLVRDNSISSSLSLRRPKHVAKYNQILIIASCFDVYCVLTVRNILYNLIIEQRDGLSLKRTTEWPKKMYTLFTHQYLWNKFK